MENSFEKFAARVEAANKSNRPQVTMDRHDANELLTAIVRLLNTSRTIAQHEPTQAQSAEADGGKW